jgi:penicillin-binding protein 1A
MSESSKDRDRYFNDPEYRKEKMKPNNHKTSAAWYQKFNNKFGYLILAVIVVILFLIGFIIYLYSGLPSLTQLENPKVAQASLVVSEDGVVLDRYYRQNRTNVSLDEISPYVVQALISTEDHRFYHHWGIDMVRTLAIPYHLLQGRVEGGSTITQQLARNLYKQIGRKFSVTRKLRGMITAVNIERHYTKPQIIDMYLNTVEFPNSTFGIEAASETHYGKPAKNLTILQAAMLVGSVNAVYAYNPRIFPKRAKRRRNVVLSQMEDKGFISDSTLHTLQKKPIVLDYHPPSHPVFRGRYFGEYVYKKIKPWAKKHGYNLYTDGLVIHTTINSRLQRYARQALVEKVDSLQKIFENEWTSPHGSYMDQLWTKYPHFLTSFIKETDRYKNGFSRYHTKKQSVVLDSLMADKAFIDSVKRANTKLDAGFVAIDPKTGKIRAWIGGRDYGQVQFDHVYQAKRQTGSSFKPFVYTVAIDNGYKPYSRFSKKRPTFYNKNGLRWSPGSTEAPKGPEKLTLRRGLAQSLNDVTVNILPALAGAPGTTSLDSLLPAAKKIKQMASNFGIDMSHTKAYPSIALGTARASLLAMTSAYTTFANKGVHVDPIAITEIDDKHGNIIKQFHPPSRQVVISPQTAYMMIDMLRNVIRGGKIQGGGTYYGTGLRLQSKYHVEQDIAGKTGTTQNATATWFIATTPDLTIGAGVGGRDRRVRWPVWSRTGQGAHTALPIVGRFIDLASSDPQTNWKENTFIPPPGFVMPEPQNDSTWENGTRINW